MSRLDRASIAARAACVSLLTLVLVGAGCGESGADSAGTPGPGSGTGSGSAGSGGTAGQSGTNPMETGTGTGAGGSTFVGGAGTMGGAAGDETGTAGSSGAGQGGTGGTGSPVDGGVPGDASMTGGAGATGTAGSGGGCSVTIAAIDPTSFNSLVAGPSSVLEMQARVSGYAAAPKWMWSVQRINPDGSTVDLTTTAVDDTGATVEVPLATPGQLAVRAFIYGASLCSYSHVYTINAPQMPSFVFRVTPPSGSSLPVTETVLPATSVAAGVLPLDLGNGGANGVVSLTPVDGRGNPLPSFLRLTSPSFTFDLEAYSGQIGLIAPLVPNLSYDLLIVPDDSLAPMLVSGTPSALEMLLGSSITPGLTVTGTALDGAGKPVVGAHVLLRNVMIPSTVGVTAANGGFSLSARDGMLSAEIVPPDGSGLPTAHVGPDIVLLAEEMNLSLTMTWAPVTSGALSVTVRDVSGALVEGARVRADATGDLSSVGTLAVEAPGVAVADAQLTAKGSVEANGVTDAQGVAQLGLLPAGSYHITVSPPDGTAAAVTMSDVMLTASGLAASTPLAAPVTLRGSLTPVGPTAGATITALDQGVLASSTVPSAVAAADGSYALMLSPGRTYELLVEPAAGQPLGAGVVSIVTPGPSAAARTDVVPMGLAWSGVVTGGGRPVAGAVVQVFCSGPACLDSSIAVAQGTTRADGTLSLTLPRPPTPP